MNTPQARSRRRSRVLTLHRSLITRTTSSCPPSEDSCLCRERASRFFATCAGWQSSRRSNDFRFGTREPYLWPIKPLLGNLLWGVFHCRSFSRTVLICGDLPVADSSTLVSPDSMKSRKLIPLLLQVSQMLSRTRYSRKPFSVHVPPITRRNSAKARMAFSALLLFQGTPSWAKNVNSFSRFF